MRTVTDTLPEFPNTEITFYRRGGSFTLDEAYPPRQQSVTTDSNGAYSIDLWPNTEGLSETSYLAMYPGKEAIPFTLDDGGDPITMAELRAQEAWDWHTNPVPAAISVERARYANQSNVALGSALVGYVLDADGAEGRTLQSKIAERVSVKDFGALGDGSTNDTDAFQAAAAWLTANSGGTLSIPAGVYIVGRQNATTLVGETLFNVTDCTGAIVIEGNNAVIRTEPGLFVGDPVFTASRTTNTTYALGDVVAPASRNGYKYECTTAGTTHIANTPLWSTATALGSTIADGTVVWTNIGTLAMASPGLTLSFQRNSGTVTIRDLELDGNAPNLVYHSGRTEVNSDGVFDADNTGGVYYSNVYAHDYTRDGFQVTDRRYLRDSYPVWQPSTFYYNGALVVKTAALAAAEVGYHFRMGTSGGGTSGATEPVWPTTVGATVVDNGMTWTNVGTNGRTQRILINCRGEYNGRQGLTWSGGIGLMAIGCSFSYQGRGATSTAPRAGVDIEPAGLSAAREGVFINCSMVDNAGVGFTTPNARFVDGTPYVSTVTLDNCTINGTTYYSTWLSSPNIVVKGGRISGSTGLSFHGRMTAWALPQPWEADTLYNQLATVTAIAEDGNEYEYQATNSGRSGDGVGLVWPSVEDDRVEDGTITWVHVGDGVTYKVGRVRVPSVPNGSRYRVIVAGAFGGTEPTWPTTLGATVVDGTITWINDGPDYVPSEVTRFETVLFDGVPHNGRGPYYRVAVLTAEAKSIGMGLVFNDCTVMAGGNTVDQRALYITGSTNYPAMIKGLTVHHRQASITGNMASLLSNVVIRDSTFYEGPMVTSAQYISVSDVTVGPNVVVKGPNVHWSSTSGPTGTIVETSGPVNVVGDQTVAGEKTFTTAPKMTSLASGGVLYISATGQLTTAGASLFWDHGNSRLGIGTGSPSRILDVRSTTSSAANISTVNSGTAVTNVSGVQVTNTDTTTGNWAGVVFGDTATGVSSALMGAKMTDRTNHYADVAFATRAADGYLERLRILSTGNVGIGTTAAATLFHVNMTDALTATTSVIETISRTSTGATAAGYGVGRKWQLKSSTTVAQDVVQEEAVWATATHASRKGRYVLSVFDTAAREALRVEASGTAAMVGFLGAAAQARPAAYTQTYATASRTHAAYTPDEESTAYTGAVDGEARLADLNALRVAYENLRAAHESTKQVLNQLIDDLQGYGLLS